MKIMYVNDSCYNFVDKKGVNQAQLLVEGRSLNFLDVRIFQLASMINGKWCKEAREVEQCFFKIQDSLSPEEIGSIVKEFRLFSYNSGTFISNISLEVKKILFKLNPNCNFSLFLVENYEKGTFLNTPLKDLFGFYESLNRAGLFYVYQIVNLTEKQLMQIRCIGKNKFSIIKNVLEENGFLLKHENYKKTKWEISHFVFYFKRFFISFI